MKNKVLAAIALATTVAAGAFAGYKLATDDELRGRLLRELRISSIHPRRKWM
ncbi:MAG: hypothetical protein ACLU0O_03370 [Collinsella sp.]